jgi:Na+/serine symporter
MLFTLFDGTLQACTPILITFLVAGTVLTSRKVVSDHSWFDLLAGFILGMVSQLLPIWL